MKIFGARRVAQRGLALVASSARRHGQISERREHKNSDGPIQSEESPIDQQCTF